MATLPKTSKTVSLIVTGFGPFGTHVPDNPTTHLTLNVKEYCRQHQITVTTETETANEQQPPNSVSLASLITATLVVETSAQAVRDQIDALYQQLFYVNEHHDDVAVSNNKPTDVAHTIILLHLGVHTKATCFHVEQCAYNDATFRIPDQRGFQPHQECIVPDVEHGVTLFAPWNVPACLDAFHQSRVVMTATTTRSDAKDPPPVHPATIPLESADASQDEPDDCIAKPSTDPGRFVCNYLYCYSLAKFCPTPAAVNASGIVTAEHRNNTKSFLDAKKGADAFKSESENVIHHSSSNQPTTKDASDTITTLMLSPQDKIAIDDESHSGRETRTRVYPLFLHVPPFSVVPEEEQLNVITQLIKCLYQQICCSV